jgi:hypothetical protein
MNIWLSFLLVTLCTVTTFSQQTPPINCPKAIRDAIKDAQDDDINMGTSRAQGSGFADRSRALKVGDLKNASKLVTDYLDSRPDLANAGSAAPDGLTQDILGKLGDLHMLELDLPGWKRALALQKLPQVTGVIDGTESTTLYLQGATRQYSVEVSRGGQVRLLTPGEANSKYLAYTTGEIKKNSTGNMTLFDLLHYPDGRRVLAIGDKLVSLSQADLAQLAAGQPFSDSHSLSLAVHDESRHPKVLFSDPFMQKQGPVLREADDFAFKLQRAYPEVAIYRDPLSPKTDGLVRQLNDFVTKTPSDVVAIVADESFKNRPKDYNVIQDLEQQLSAAHIRIVRYRPGVQMASVGRGKGLIVITGHSSGELAEFVRRLGSQGIFEGNFVVFNSCETPLSRQLITEINTRYNAIATFAHEGKIMVNDLDGFLGDFALDLNKGSTTSFHEMLIRQLHNHRLNGVWTICRLSIDRRSAREDA